MTMTTYSRTIALTIVLLIVIPQIGEGLCSEDKPIKEDTVWRTTNWTQLYHAYLRFGAQADGVVAGAFSEKIGDLLSEHWDDLPSLRKLTDADESFRHFVFMFLDETVPVTKAERIIMNAESACPSDDEAPICEKLIEILR